MGCRLCASHFLALLALSLLAVSSCGERTFYFSYNHHGEDWMEGECGSRDRQSPIDFGPTAPWSCDPPKVFMLKHFLGMKQFQELFPGLSDTVTIGAGDSAAPAPGPAASASASASFLELNMTQWPMMMPIVAPGPPLTPPFGSPYGMPPMMGGMPVMGMPPAMGMMPMGMPMGAPMGMPMGMHMGPMGPGAHFGPLLGAKVNAQFGLRSPMELLRLHQQLEQLNPPTPEPMLVPGCGQLGAFYFKYDKVDKPLTIQNNGHAISIDMKGHGLGGITWDGFTFDVLSINFHAHSEHTFHGESLPLELHIVHREPETDHILIVAVPFDYTPNDPEIQRRIQRREQREKQGVQGNGAQQGASLLQRKRRSKRGFLEAGDIPKKPPTDLDPLHETDVVDPNDVADSANLTPEEQEQITPLTGGFSANPIPTEAGFSKILENLYDLPLPSDGETKPLPLRAGPVDLLSPLMGGDSPLPEAFFQYRGSLTAPPCSEQVTWLVRKEPVYASWNQLELFRMVIMKSNSNSANARSTMPLMARHILYRLGINGAPPPPPSAPQDPAITPHEIHVDFRGVTAGKEALAKALETAQAKNAISTAVTAAQNAMTMVTQGIDPLVASQAQSMQGASFDRMIHTPLPTPNPERVLSRIVDTVAQQMEGSERAAVMAAAGIIAAPAPAMAPR